MPSIHREVIVDVPIAQAWTVLRDVAHAERPFAGVLTDSRLEGDTRTVTFANGMVVRERIIDVDDQRRRIAYAAMGAPFTHHSASMQLIAHGEKSCRFVWISDFLPAEVGPNIVPLIDAGCAAVKRNLENGSRKGSEVAAGSRG